MERIFGLSGLLVLPLWLLIIAVPDWRVTNRIMRSPWVSAAPALLYLLLVSPRFGEIFLAVLSPRFAEIQALLGSPAGTTIAWAHFLAFDLFVGRWIYLDARERKFSALIVSPILFLTLMLGPIGFLLYLVVRVAMLHLKLTNESKNNSSAGVNLQTGVRQLLTQRIRAHLKQSYALNRALTVLAIAMLVTLAGTVVGLAVDHRVITGAPAWLKPAKFAISISIYSFTFVWLLGFIKGHPRLVSIAANVTAISFLVEIIIIVLQAARGTTSHFNLSTPIDGMLFTTMGIFIAFTWLMNLMVGLLLVKQRISDSIFKWSLRLGIAISLVGMSVAFFMVRPSREQKAAMATGQRVTAVGAHSVGVADGGLGLPIVGWSTKGGDLRAAHFVGLHAMQVLPLLGWLLRRRRFNWLTEKHRLAILFTAGGGYLGLTILLTWQALRGQSLIAPDDKTILAFSILCAITLVSLLVTLTFALRGRNNSTTTAPGMA
jgi:hypothetical protein